MKRHRRTIHVGCVKALRRRTAIWTSHGASPLRSDAPCGSAHRRRGAVMVAAAICLLLASLVLASALKLALADRRQVRREQLRTQAEWLAQAGIERAAARLADDAEYMGDTWSIEAADLDGRHAGEVVITIGRDDDKDDHRVVTATARFPTGTTPSARRTRRAVIQTSME